MIVKDFVEGLGLTPVAGASGLAIPEHKIRQRKGSAGPRPCPSCGREMLVLEAHPGSGVLIETCPKCLGFFLDRGEYDKLKEVFCRERPVAARPAVAAKRDTERHEPEGPAITIDSDSLGWAVFQYLTGLPLEADTSQALFSPVVTTIIAFNVLVFIVALVMGFEDVMLAMALKPAEILRGVRLHTLLTSMFAHGGFFHLLGNMWFLFVCGDNAERRLGWKSFTAMYLLAGLTATVAHIAGDPSSAVPCLGASGAISGVLGAYMVLFPRREFMVRFFLLYYPVSFKLAAWAYLGFWLVLQLVYAFIGLPGVAWWAHIGGFGLGVGWAYAHRAIEARSPLQEPAATT